MRASDSPVASLLSALASDGPRSAPGGRNVALLVTARLTTESANNDVGPVAAVRVIELPSSTTAAVKIGRDSATADPACRKCACPRGYESPQSECRRTS